MRVCISIISGMFRIWKFCIDYLVIINDFDDYLALGLAIAVDEGITYLFISLNGMYDNIYAPKSDNKKK